MINHNKKEIYLEKEVYLGLLASKKWELTHITNKQLKILANIVGDTLMLLEQEAIGASKNQLLIRRIRVLIDIYAEEFDEILSKYRVGVVKKVKELMVSLLTDLEKITNLDKCG